jgi:ketosteroid isomerase-like protein
MNTTLARLADAVNRHDPDAMAALFAPDYRSEQPAHPERGFGGADQVAANWRQMFAGVPDLTAEMVAEASDGDISWSEWRWSGTHTDGRPFRMRGVTLMGVGADGLIHWGRLYMEPVEEGGAGIEDDVRRLSGSSGRP